MEAARAALITRYTDPTTFYTALSAVPTSGSATYDGYLRGDLANTTDSVTDMLLGEMSMRVTFTTSSVTVTGDVSGFVDDDDEPLTGSLSLGNGSLDRGGSPTNDATLLVSASGTLTDDQGRTLVVGTQLEGDFLGTGHAAVGGEVLGSVTVNGVDQDFDGGFIAER